MDPRLGPVLPPAPQVTFKRSRTLKNIIAPSKLKHTRTEKIMDIRSYFDDRAGIFQCKKRGCLTCQFIEHGQSSFSDRSGHVYDIRQFITCSTEYVIYVLICPCKLLYVGRTMRTLRKRIGEHRPLIQKGLPEHSVPRHFKNHHGKNIRCLKVVAIEHNPGGSLTDNERFSLLCKRESFWIYKLSTLSPNG